MATTNPDAGRAVARPIPGASWHDRVRDAGEIVSRLNALWRQYGEARDAKTTSPNGQATDAPWPTVTARAATLNGPDVWRSTVGRADPDEIRTPAEARAQTKSETRPQTYLGCP